MPVLRVQVESDRATARRVMELHRADKVHHESREVARSEACRRGWTPAGEPVFVGVTNGHPVRLLYDVEIYVHATS